jgi:CMP-N-acetylneuraminic acid synthetase
MQKSEKTVLAIVPARGGSKGIARKNLRILGGLPLIVHTLQAALESRFITDLIVSTDDQEIANVAKMHNIDVPFLRPYDLASDEAAQLDVVLHALTTVERARQVQYDVVLLLQPTAPLRAAEDIDNALEQLFVTGASSVVSFYRVEQGHPYYMYSLDGDRPKPLLDVPSHITRRQDFPAVYVRNGAIYAVRREVLVSQRSFYGQDMRAYVMPFDRSVNIDTEVDLALAEFLLQRQRPRRTVLDQDPKCGTR